MSRYLEILAIQEPFTYGLDTSGRTVWACNYTMTAAYPVDKFEEEIYKYLYDLSVIGGLNVETFIGPYSFNNSDSNLGVAVHINRTSGLSPHETHNGDKYERLTMQIAVHAKSYVTGRNKAIAIWRALDGQRDVTITVP